MSNIRKISKSEINLNKIYSTKYDATTQTHSKVAKVAMWDGDLEIKMTDDPNVGLVLKNGAALGYINLVDVDKTTLTQNNTDVTFDTEDFLKSNIKSAKNTTSENYDLKEKPYTRDPNAKENVKPVTEKVDPKTINYDEKEAAYTKNRNESSSNSGDTPRLTILKQVDIPSNVSQTGIIANYTNYKYFKNKWSKGSNQRALSKQWVAAGETSDRGIATLDNRYLVAVSEKFGNVGDYIDVELDDGTVIKAIIADAKGADATSEWGHKFGRSVDIIEWESTGGQDNIDLSGWRGKKVKRISNIGNILS